MIYYGTHMKLSKLVKILNECDDAGRWFFRTKEMARLLGESGAKLNLTLHRAKYAQVLAPLARGWVYLPRAKSIPANPLDRFAIETRRPHITYASLESELARNGLISQLPMVETYMTTGREGRFNTPLGSIELVHTEKKGVLNSPDIRWDSQRGIWVATPQRALSDLRRVGRNVDLVEKVE